MEEEWRVISEFPNYSVSNTCKVKNNKTGKILKTDGKGSVNLYNGDRSTKRNRCVYSLYLKYFCGCPSGSRGRTMIRIIETGEIFFGYKAVCDALGISYEFVNNICYAAYRYTKTGEKKSVKGYHFEVLEVNT